MREFLKYGWENRWYYAGMGICFFVFGTAFGWLMTPKPIEVRIVNEVK